MKPLEKSISVEFLMLLAQAFTDYVLFCTDYVSRWLGQRGVGGKERTEDRKTKHFFTSFHCFVFCFVRQMRLLRLLGMYHIIHGYGSTSLHSYGLIWRRAGCTTTLCG